MKIQSSNIYNILLIIPCIQMLGVFNIQVGFFSLVAFIFLFLVFICSKDRKKSLDNIIFVQIISLLFLFRISSLTFSGNMQISHFNNFIVYFVTYVAFCLLSQSELFRRNNDMLPRSFFYFTLVVCFFNVIYFIIFAVLDIDLLKKLSPVIREGYFITEDDYIGLFGYKLARVGSFFGTANLCAAFILTSTPLVIYYNKRKKKLNEIFLIALLILGMLPTGSKLGIVLLLVYLSGYFMFKITSRLSFVSFLSGSIFISWILFSAEFLFEFLTARSLGEGYLGNRAIAYSAVIRDIDEFSWSGVGYGNVTGYTQISGVANVIGESLHNVVLTLIVENGFVLASLFFLVGLMVIIWLTFISGNIYFLSSMCLLVISNFFTVSLFNYVIMYCLLIWFKMLYVDRARCEHLTL